MDDPRLRTFVRSSDEVDGALSIGVGVPEPLPAAAQVGERFKGVREGFDDTFPAIVTLFVLPRIRTRDGRFGVDLHVRGRDDNR